MRVQDVALMAGQRDMKGLESALDDEDGNVQKAAVTALMTMADAAAVDAFSAAFRGSNESAMGLAAAGLQRIADPRVCPEATTRARAIDALVETIRWGNATAQNTVMVALSEIGGAAVIDALSAAIVEPISPGRIPAAMTLLRIGTPDAAEALVECFRAADEAGRLELAAVLQNVDLKELRKPLKKPWWRIW